MSELAHGAMLVGALGGAACVATGRRTGLDLAASAAMLAAMADMALTRLVPPLAWTAVLAGIGIALGARLRAARDPGGLDRSPGRRSHALHRALAFIVGAWAFAAAGDASTNGPGVAGHSHGGSAAFAFIAAAVAMTAFGGWLVAVELRTARPARGIRPHGVLPGATRHAAEAASTTVMLAAMAAPGVLAALG
ncbi:hypothetical protein ACFPER_11270 [Agromyces aurantiacus]|uniref:DUF5134 domain-containing protein n=1 Tax=Agromyces aurantiacus TaxID=165814 RepID=A0ABV9R6L5_9MICO|nr:hypothetical protein [Agromyces aurantiacus]MBM7504058.1 hypothetical protein [Agromyces aurantiacus]